MASIRTRESTTGQDHLVLEVGDGVPRDSALRARLASPAVRERRHKEEVAGMR